MFGTLFNAYECIHEEVYDYYENDKLIVHVCLSINIVKISFSHKPYQWYRKCLCLAQESKILAHMFFKCAAFQFR